MLASVTSIFLLPLSLSKGYLELPFRESILSLIVL